MMCVYIGVGVSGCVHIIVHVYSWSWARQGSTFIIAEHPGAGRSLTTNTSNMPTNDEAGTSRRQSVNAFVF